MFYKLWLSYTGLSAVHSDLCLPYVLPLGGIWYQSMEGNGAYLVVASEHLLMTEFQGEFALSPGYHGQDQGYYFTS